MFTQLPVSSLHVSAWKVAESHLRTKKGIAIFSVMAFLWLPTGCSRENTSIFVAERLQDQVPVDGGIVILVADIQRWRTAPAGVGEVGLVLGRYDVTAIMDLSSHPPDSRLSPCVTALLRPPRAPMDSGYSESVGCTAERFDEILPEGLVRATFATDASNAGMACLISEVWNAGEEPPEPEVGCFFQSFRDPLITMGGRIGGGGMAVSSLYPRSLQVGHNSACLLTEEGHPICYGFGPDHRPVADEVFDSLVSTGPGLACGLRADGTVRCWGREAEGELAAPPGEYIEQCAGPYHWCGLTADGQVRCLGEDLYGETEIPEGPVYGALACNLESTCVAEVGGGVQCYGRFADDVLQPPEGLQAWRLAVNVRNACALLKDGGLQCWGDYDLHRDAAGTWTPALAPRPQDDRF
jgi:hypothetical protein